MAAEQDAIKQLPPNIRNLKKAVRKEWAKKLVPAVKAKTETEANRLIAMATGLEPRVVAGIRGNLKGTTPPPHKPKGGKTKEKKETGESEGGTRTTESPDATVIAKQVTDQVTQLFGERLGKLEKTVEAALTGQGNGSPKTITIESPGTTLELPGNASKVALSPLTQMYYAYSMKAAQSKGLDQITVSDFINRTIEEFFQEKGYHFAMLRREELSFKEGTGP